MDTAVSVFHIHCIHKRRFIRSYVSGLLGRKSGGFEDSEFAERALLHLAR